MRSSTHHTLKDRYALEIGSTAHGGHPAATIALRRDAFLRTGVRGGKLSLRAALARIAGGPRYALPPKCVPTHPRLSAQPSIHYDHYNSSVTNLDAPRPDSASMQLKMRRATGVLGGIALNFCADDRGRVACFTGELRDLRIAFEFTTLDDDLDTVDQYELATVWLNRVTSWLPGERELPVELGYFVMNADGDVICVENDSDIVFLRVRPDRRIEVSRRWRLEPALRRRLEAEVVDQPLVQVMPDEMSGYWVTANGEADRDGTCIRPAFVGRLGDDGQLLSVHVLRGEILENGIATAGDSAYVLSDRAMYRFTRDARGRCSSWTWRVEYQRATTVKPGTEELSRFGSGSTPTLFGRNDDLLAFTDNADGRVRLEVLHRSDGRRVCEPIPLFEDGKSANENTLVGYDDTLIVQNWYGCPAFDQDLIGLEPGLWRIDIAEDRSGATVVWRNRAFASPGTVRLSTRSGLLYATSQVGRGDRYALTMVDFKDGSVVGRIPLWPGKRGSRRYRISLQPAYIIPGGRVVQPMRAGMAVVR